MHYGRGYHSLSSSFGKVFHVEKRWELVREMGAGAYGVVMYVSTNSYLHYCTTQIETSVLLLMKFRERLSPSS